MATPVSSQLLGEEDKDRILKSLPMLHKCVDLGGLMKAHLRQRMIIDLKDEQQIEVHILYIRYWMCIHMCLYLTYLGHLKRVYIGIFINA